MCLRVSAFFIAACALFAAESTLLIEVRDTHGAPAAGAVVEMRSGSALVNHAVRHQFAARFALRIPAQCGLAARNFFDRRCFTDPRCIPPFVRNEFGLPNCCPVFIPHRYDGRHRTLYFFEYQGLRQALGR
jgi:hypothetical protein